MLNVILSVYSSVKFRVKTRDGLTDKISSKIGVKQGCNLSPLLFNIFTYDLPKIFDKYCNPVRLYDEDINFCFMQMI